VEQARTKRARPAVHRPCRLRHAGDVPPRDRSLRCHSQGQQLIQLCRGNGILICFARADHRLDGQDFTRVIADVDRWFDPWTDRKPQPVKPSSDPPPDYMTPAELGQLPADIDIPKHRWSAFHGTALDLTLRVQNVDTVMIIGGGPLAAPAEFVTLPAVGRAG